MSKPNLYVMKINDRERVFSVSQLCEEADIPKRAARRCVKRAIKNGEVEIGVIRPWNRAQA